ncbi:hypothetical protein [Pseudoteredinibacter isoporae]|uniref:DUF4231 domain-containing protein n=1 Tax=Pseudoteredinibacter isoporae TaxID=570281 RepID=A0A7X0MZ54_9GAMM|nr:hypothetical protein [Pseudoteredinibacter isoporae]MBB6522782.1 hypothetical protein [Pseudoteredinibacter isoporae]NHO88309.1 hypothetical protein [Pseudoteredinibacter isoporae]NIB23360.1 hypothetical protein [Pseudoteredinibacter isoporae]
MNDENLKQLKNYWFALKAALYQHYTASQRQIFKQFRLGSGLFFLGMVSIYGCYQLLEASLGREVGILISLMIVLSGFMIAMLAQIRLLIGRILHFIYH